MRAFPEAFRFGVADADLQVIGEDAALANEGGEESMWSVFARTSGRVVGNATPGVGIERYSRWADDVALLADLGLRHYRTSVSMSRLLTRSGDVNSSAADWYRRYFGALQARGIKVYATLYHWELPQFLDQQGGWTNRDTVEWFIRHARHVVRELGEFVEEYFLVNEPWCAAMLGYFHGAHAPGVQDLRSALQAAHHLLLAIGLGQRAIAGAAPSAKVGTVFNSEPYYAATEAEADRLARAYADGSFNRWFMDPLFLGRYPDDMCELYREHLPAFPDDDLRAIKVGADLHAFGQNYYCGKYVRHSAESALRFEEVNPPGRLTNDLGWPVTVPPVYPSGLYDMILQIWHTYKSHGLKRIYITENGLAQHTRCGADGRPEDDARRVLYLQEHLDQVRRAVLAGVPVEAYFAWTLMDNYEWSEGYRPESCFGLVHVDRASMRRQPKASARWYQQVATTRQL